MDQRRLSGHDNLQQNTEIEQPEYVSSNEQADGARRLLLATPSQLSEISSLLESVVTNGEEGW